MMAAAGTEPTFRITVVLGGAEPSRSLLDTLLPIVRGRSAEVLGLFVEDAELLRLAALPFSQELCRLTLTERRLDPAEMERQFRVRARLAQRTLDAALGVEHARCSFRTVRGTLGSLLPDEAGDVDVVVVGPGRALFRSADRSARGPAPVVVASTESEAGHRARELGARLAQTSQRPLMLIALASAPAADEPPAARSAGREPPMPRPVPADPVLIAESARRAGAHALIVEARPEWLAGAGLRALRAELPCPVLLVR